MPTTRPPPGSPPSLADSQASMTTANQLETQTQLSTLPPVSRAPGVALILGESQPTQQQQQQWSVSDLGRLGSAQVPARPAATCDDSQGSAEGGAANVGPGSASIASEWKLAFAFPAGSSLESSLHSAPHLVGVLIRPSLPARSVADPAVPMPHPGPWTAAQGEPLVRGLQSA